MTQKAIIDGVERWAISMGWNTVACDHPGCTAETYVERTQVRAEAREEAGRKGWTYVDGRDLCPAHTGKR